METPDKLLVLVSYIMAESSCVSSLLFRLTSMVAVVRTSPAENVLVRFTFAA